jgi:flagellar export protein FliJ
MKSFAFSLGSVWKLRCHERDVCRQCLAQLFAQEHQLADMRQQTEAARQTQFEELRLLEAEGRGVDAEASASRRSYVERLTDDLRTIDDRRTELNRQIEIRRQELILADQSVKALAKLADKRKAAFLLEQQRKDAAALEEVWRAVHSTRDRARIERG